VANALRDKAICSYLEESQKQESFIFCKHLLNNMEVGRIKGNNIIIVINIMENNETKIADPWNRE